MIFFLEFKLNCSFYLLKFVGSNILAYFSFSYRGDTGWSHIAQFTIVVVNRDPKRTKYSGMLANYWLNYWRLQFFLSSLLIIYS